MDDLAWWLQLMPNWDGIHLIEEEFWRNEQTENLFTDASDWGGGATYSEYFTVFAWNAGINLKECNIQVREMYALVVAVLTF